MLTESILLSVVGAGLGLLLSQSLSRFLVLFLSSESNRLALSLHADWRILLYTAGLVAVTCLVFGLTPALRGTRVGPGAAMKATGRGMTLDRQRFGVRRAIVIARWTLARSAGWSVIVRAQPAKSRKSRIRLSAGRCFVRWC
jgi:hypothetical protein